MTGCRDNRTVRLLVALLGAALLLTGCASIPSSSPPEVFSESPQATTAPENEPRYDAIRPQGGEPPLDIVKDFLAVGGSHQQQHAGARAYLTPSAAKKWKDAAGVVALEEEPVYYDDNQEGIVSMAATQRGRVNLDGSYEPNAAPYPYKWDLKKVDGEWRIDNPPPGILVFTSTFERAWRPYNVYFLDSTRTRVVPDVRMVPYPQDTALPSLLVDYLGAGPSAALEGAVVSDLEGVRLQSNIVRDNQGVGVYLTGLGGDETLAPGGFAQLVWTLNQLGVGGIEVFLDGEPIAPPTAPRQTLQRFGDWRGFDPNALAVSTPGYFIRDGAVFTTSDQPVPGPVGNGAYSARSVGVSLDQRSIAVVGGRARGVGLYVGRPGQTLRLALTGSSMTAPTWGSAVDEVWTVRNGREVVLVQRTGQTSRVTAPALERLGPVSSLRLSRDGARVALVAGPARRQQLYLGVVVRQAGAVRIDLDDDEPVDVGEGLVVDVSWSDALTVTALVRPSALESSLYTVGVDRRTSGQLVGAAGLPAAPSAVAAAPNLPLLAVAGGTVWRLPGPGESWKPIAERSTTGSAPAYPG